MLRVRSWAKHQAAIIKHVKSSRRTRGMPEDSDLVMQRFNLTSSWDRDFIEKFAPAVGQRSAEAFFVRLLQYVATHAGMSGECRVPRDEFGPLVLSRVGDQVSKKEGQRVYDALMSAGLAERITGDARPSDTCVNTGVNTGDALPCRAVPLQSDPPHSVPSRSGPGGGVASPSATTASDLNLDDRTVFEVLWRKRDRMLAADAREADRLRASLLTTSPESDAIRNFIERMTPKFLDDVERVRRVKRMEANARKETA